MHKSIIVLFLIGLLSSCQSAKVATLPLNTGAYGNKASLKPVTAASPILTAELPDERGNTALKVNRSTPIEPTSKSIALPDTILKQPPIMPSIADFKPDPATTVINVVGAAVAVTGLVLAIDEAGSGPSHTEWGGLTSLIQIASGIVLFILGVFLLFYQGENGRQRLLKQALNNPSLPNSKPEAPTSVQSQASKLENAQLQKQQKRAELRVVGGSLMVTGTLLAATSLLLSFPLLYPAILVATIGLMVFILGV